MAEIEAELARRAEANAQPETQPEPPPVVEVKPEPPPVVEEAAPAKTPEAMPEPESEPETVVKAKPAVNSPEEAEARAMLARQGDTRKLSDDQLRRRLDTMRELLSSRKLSKPTQRELRQALAQERNELRRRLRSEQASAPDVIMPEPDFEPDAADAPALPPASELSDGPPPEDLSEAEIRRRIMQRRALQRDARLSPEQRAAWREASARDREYLHERMVDDRRRRERDLRTGTHDWDFDIDVGIGIGVGRPWRRDVFAAEADDEEMVGVLVAPARRRFDRRYTMEEIERTPQLREAVARIEIDTVHFGFGEGFLREEEIDKLDRIAAGAGEDPGAQPRRGLHDRGPHRRGGLGRRQPRAVAPARRRR